MPGYQTRYSGGNGITPAQASAIWLPSTIFLLHSGAPASGSSATGNTPGWLFDAAGTESIATTFRLPSWWTTYDVTYYWGNASTGAGDVRWTLVHHAWVAGDTVSSGGSSAGVTATASTTQWLLTTTKVATGLTVSASAMTRLRVNREGGNAADTLANDSVLWGVLLERAS